MGTPPFAVPSLDVLLDAHEVVAVYTRPDAATGRGRRITASAVKKRALETGVSVEQPTSLRDPDAVASIGALGADLIVVAAYGAVLPPEVLEMPRFGCINVHASLLPRWRGAAPVQRAILAGDELTGVSIMRMEEGLDTGPWCEQVSTIVDGKNAAQLTSELARLGAEALLATIARIATGECEWTAQDDAMATYAPKIAPADVALHPGLTVHDAWRRVRASGASAPCRLAIGGRRVTLVSAALSPRDARSGRVLTEGFLDLGLADGALRVVALVPQGRAPMAASDWLRGARLGPDVTWSAL
jgi:methionyl-tRNA formyltransferase